MFITSWHELKIESPSAVSCGVFDGLHRGHRALIDAVTRRSGLQSVVVTFRKNPRSILRPEHHVGDVITLEKKIERLTALGVDTLVLVDFSNEFRAMSGEEFIKSLIDKASMRLFVIGEDFKCGAGGAFDANCIVKFCEKNNVETLVVKPVLDGGAPISSSRIRAALRNGDNETAVRLLGW